MLNVHRFGGTNGFQWFNDVWCYDAATNQWSQLDCIGYIPVPREGHAATLVEDVMYIFGGRTEEGADLGDLAAFRITSRRWYTFQNMGPSPSPRSGHSMTTVGKSIVVVGGEPSSTTTAVNDLALVYLLDTAKIRYPNDSQANGPGQKNQSTRRASDAQATRSLQSKDGSSGPPDPKRLMGATRDAGSGNGVNGSPDGVSRQTPKLNGAGTPPQPIGNMPSSRASNPIQDGTREEPSVAGKTKQSPVVSQGSTAGEAPVTNGRRTPTQQTASRSASRQSDAAVTEMKLKSSSKSRGQGSVDSSTEPTLKQINKPMSPPPAARQSSTSVSRRSSGRNSQTVTLLKELDAARNRIAWYSSELELARKAGYSSNASMSPILNSRWGETFDDEDKPLIEALIAMRTELAKVQSSVDKQAVLAARQIAEAERQRNAAIQEAVYAKAKLAARLGGSPASSQLDSDKDGDDRVGHMSRKLATALHTQKESQNQVERLKDEIEAERRARKLADDTTNAAQKRMEDLEGYKQQTSLELERLKADLHDAQREARAKAIEATEAVAALQLIKVETKEFENMYKDAVGSSKDHSNTIGSLRTAVAASAETKLLLERQLEEERAHREMVETKLSKLKAEHEARTAELVAAQQRLRDAEEMVEKHANEARTHREAVLAGLDKITARDMPAAQKDQSDRIVALRGQLSAANALARKYQQEADTASERLRSAEERIAGLEAYQEQASREGVSIRRQLQSALRETQSLQAANSEIRQQLESQQLEANAITVQHNTLKDILSERGISPTSAGRVRGLSSPQNSSPELARLRDLEQQLAATAAAHEETKNTAATQAQEAEFAYREKLAQLENDYQSAVHYVKGLEKSLKQLKEQLTRYKADNSQLKEQIVELEDQLRDGEAPEKHAPEDWEEQRQALEAQVQQSQTEMKTSAAELEKQLQALRQELSNATKERQTAVHDIQAANQRLDSTKKDIEQLQQENALLERRALDAEAKVGSLLDQVEISVDNYRRRSRQVPSTGSDHGGGGGSSSGGGSHGASVPPNGISHARQESSEIGSVYGSLSEARNSGALDSLANELDMLRSQWEATSKNYRLSNNFEFEGQRGNHGSPSAEKKSESVSLGLSGSLADWRKRLDETHPEGSQPAK